METLQGSDNVHIFPEKLYDNEDNLHSPENKVYSPKELMEMDWLDACVHGKLPHYDELDVKTRTVLAINGLDNVKGSGEMSRPSGRKRMEQTERENSCHFRCAL